ncbi:helix-turn-helix transcriptional regulator [Actinopolyspora sp. BKK1]|nr:MULTISPECIES: LuxR C-terminal-related transcriptional regulator [unclassified Actinopolyspora]NHD19218.1 helix-turn-helix transcriptional regulator [Actinopolyspora sp. BKK2]NHE78342.1 helix-turn-helix transcriptional regulator [Actinopolyspora sp. BKK1]
MGPFVNHPSATRPAPDAGSAHHPWEVVQPRAAEGLREEIAANPSKPVTAVVRGVGGSGKTTLLARLARIYRDAGVAVHDSVEAALAEPDPGGAALLLDDAQLLRESTLRELLPLVSAGPVRVVLACRPWPCPEPLSELISRFGRNRPVVNLGELSSGEIGEQLRRMSGASHEPETVERIRAFSGGIPALLGHTLEACDPRELTEPEEVRLSRLVLDRFGEELGALDELARRCLTALSVGGTTHPVLLGTVLGVESTDVAPALEELRAAGLLDELDAPHPFVRNAVLALTSWEKRLAVLRVLVRNQLDRAGSVARLMCPLLGTDSALPTDPVLASGFEAAGREVLFDSPELAVRMFDSAVATGSPAVSVAARRARAVALRGELDEAVRTADRVIVDESAPERDLAIRVSATVLAHRGLPERSAELCRWSARHVPWAGDTAFAVLGLVDTGRIAEAGELLRDWPDAGPPTSVSGAGEQLARGFYDSVTGSSPDALSTLVRSASLAEPVGAELLAPDTPAAVAATVATHCGEFDVADSVLDRALAADAGGPLARVRHRLLAVWPPLLKGDTTTARRELDRVVDDPAVLPVKDRLVAIALEAGIASRDNDMSALERAVFRARKAVAEHPADLFALLPLSELAVAGARLRDRDWLLPQLREAHELLNKFDEPALWAAPLYWRELQAAIVLDDRERAAEHAAALARVSGGGQFATALSEAAEVWLRLLDGEVDEELVRKTARGLCGVGLVWDGAGLAGQAALRTKDRGTMLALLECARSLQGKSPRPYRHPADGTSGVGPSGGEGELLSDREREVAELVLGGMTYKQVGQRLFISAKTVEHHIGRIKQRLDCSTREELLARLRSLLGQ